MSVIRMLGGVLPAILVAWLLYAYNLFALGPVVVLFFMNLMMMGWAVALGVVSLILRHGAGAEALAWSVLFGLTPFSAVFYPVAVLPRVLQPIALALPSAHVFEGMRGVAAPRRGAMGPPGRRVRAERGLDGWRCDAVRPPVPPGPVARGAAEHRGMMAGSCLRSCPAMTVEGLAAPGTTMSETRFWLIRHAIVDENARAMLYGVMDVPLCETSLLEQAPMYQRAGGAAAAAGCLEGHAAVAHPPHRGGDLRRRLSARRAGRSKPELIEQSLGEWQGLPHAELPARLTLPKHAFWPLAGTSGRRAARRWPR